MDTPIKPDYTDYKTISDENKKQFMEMMRLTMPELHIVATMMERVNANPAILFHIMSHMADIANGTGFGQVHIIIEDGVVRFVKGEHSTKLNEPIILGKLLDNNIPE